MEENNKIILRGVVINREQGYTVKDVSFDLVTLETKRLNNKKSDTIDVYIPKETILNFYNNVEIIGTLRSRNYKDEAGKSHCNIYVQANKITILEDISNLDAPANRVELNGFICKQPILRETPKKKVICDSFLAVHRNNKKSDYIPLITWYELAEKISKQKVGDKLKVVGMLQSRDYVKDEITHKVLEVSVLEYEQLQ